MKKNSPENRVYISQSHKRQELYSLELHIIQYGFNILIWFIAIFFLNIQFLALHPGILMTLGRLVSAVVTNHDGGPYQAYPGALLQDLGNNIIYSAHIIQMCVQYCIYSGIT